MEDTTPAASPGQIEKFRSACREEGGVIPLQALLNFMRILDNIRKLFPFLRSRENYDNLQLMKVYDCPDRSI